MPHHRTHARQRNAGREKVEKKDEDYTFKIISPKAEKARLLEAITAVLQTKSNASLAALLTSLEGIPDDKFSYPKIKHAQQKFDKYLLQPESQN